jgi:WD repeat and FYVE domain-containing protein 3
LWLYSNQHFNLISLSIDDPLKKNATIGFINNFGQIPKQLFKKPHPSKKMSGSRHSVIDPTPMLSGSGSVPFEKMFFHNLDNLKPSLQPVKGESSRVNVKPTNS